MIRLFFLAAMAVILPCVVMAQAVNPQLAGLEVAVELLDEQQAALKAQLSQQGVSIPPSLEQCFGQLKQVPGNPGIIVVAQATCGKAEAAVPPRVRPIIKEVVKVVEVAARYKWCDVPESQVAACFAALEADLETDKEVYGMVRDVLLGRKGKEGVSLRDLRSGDFKVVLDRQDSIAGRKKLEIEWEGPDNSAYTPAMAQPLVSPAPRSTGLSKAGIALILTGGALAGLGAGALLAPSETGVDDGVAFFEDGGEWKGMAGGLGLAAIVAFVADAAMEDDDHRPVAAVTPDGSAFLGFGGSF